jgi:hypothetical protein
MQITMLASQEDMIASSTSVSSEEDIDVKSNIGVVAAAGGEKRSSKLGNLFKSGSKKGGGGDNNADSNNRNGEQNDDPMEMVVITIVTKMNHPKTTTTTMEKTLTLAPTLVPNAYHSPNNPPFPSILAKNPKHPPPIPLGHLRQEATSTFAWGPIMPRPVRRSQAWIICTKCILSGILGVPVEPLGVLRESCLFLR